MEPSPWAISGARASLRRADDGSSTRNTHYKLAKLNIYTFCLMFNIHRVEQISYWNLMNYIQGRCPIESESGNRNAPKPDHFKVQTCKSAFCSSERTCIVLIYITRCFMRL